jgi:hypothetical protein
MANQRVVLACRGHVWLGRKVGEPCPHCQRPGKLWSWTPVPKARELKDVNPHLRKSQRWILGFLACANFINELRCANGDYAAGDCALLKFNLINKRQMRKVRK